MKEYLSLSEFDVRVVKALNEVHKSQNFHPWTFRGESGYYLSTDYLNNDGVPPDFLDFFKKLKIKRVKDKKLKMVRWDDFTLHKKEEEIRAAWDNMIPDLPENLFHYTTADGLLGLTESNKIWATHYSFLNDYNEFNYAKTLIQEILVTFKSHDFVEGYLDNWKLFDEQFKYYNIFIVSFSEVGDRLSQWRGYANHGQGYSIGFKTSIIGLSTPPKKPNRRFLLRKVAYDRKSQTKRLKEIVKNTINQSKKGTYKGDFHRALEFYKRLHINAFLELLTFKSTDFAEEQEWRAIHVQWDFDSLYPDNHKMKFRSNGKEVIPYIELDLSPEVGDNNTKGKLPLTEVIYGPSINGLMADKSLKFLLDKRRYFGVKISKSKLTLR